MSEREGHSPDALRWATEAHYEDAERYDRTYRLRKHDVAFYEEITAELGGGPVLELGIGTGRVAFALARAGHEVVGVERMASMLDRLRERVKKEPRDVAERIQLVKGDIRRFALGRRFPVVIAPFNVLMHLYSHADFEAMLATVRAHLAPRGAFVFDVRMPDVRSFLRDPLHAYRCPPLRDPVDGKLYETAELFQLDMRTQVQMITSTYKERGNPSNVYVKPLAHRQFFPMELELLLRHAGFTIESFWGDFERGVVDIDAESQVIVARLSRAARREEGAKPPMDAAKKRAVKKGPSPKSKTTAGRSKR